MRSQLIRKDRDAGKDGGQKEKGATEDEMVGWHQVRGWRAWSRRCGARRLAVTWGSFSRAGGDW